MHDKMRISMRIFMRSSTNNVGAAMLDFRNSAKRPANLTLNAKVLDAARELGINISQTVDDLLQKEVRRLAVKKWAEDNAGTVAAYNRRVHENGLWNEDLRKLRGQV